MVVMFCCYSCAVLDTVAAEVPAGSALATRVLLCISIRVFCGARGAERATAEAAREEDRKIPPAAAAAASFPPLSDAITGTTDTVTCVLRSDAEHTGYVSSSVMPLEGRRKRSSTRSMKLSVNTCKPGYRRSRSGAKGRAIRTWVVTAQLRNTWFWTECRRQKAKQITLRRANELLNLVGVELESTL
ncbi:hypothetical protein K456DRAFT_38993 [Colletotrichum gloeosporioides 23]|nr:hypothetical protein K456DRAFT_38993 [Colletotrichum gloeosporioides 23]